MGPCHKERPGERSEPSALTCSVLGLSNLSLQTLGRSGAQLGEKCVMGGLGGRKPGPHPGIYSSYLPWKIHFASQSPVSASVKSG